MGSHEQEVWTPRSSGSSKSSQHVDCEQDFNPGFDPKPGLLEFGKPFSNPGLLILFPMLEDCCCGGGR